VLPVITTVLCVASRVKFVVVVVIAVPIEPTTPTRLVGEVVRNAEL